jgi:hypothetical protein
MRAGLRRDPRNGDDGYPVTPAGRPPTTGVIKYFPPVSANYHAPDQHKCIPVDRRNAGFTAQHRGRNMFQIAF